MKGKKMGRKKKVLNASSRILVLNDGSEHKIISQDGKYYHCENASFRILRKDYFIKKSENTNEEETNCEEPENEEIAYKSESDGDM